MTAHVTMHRNGGWTVELQIPAQYAGNTFDKVSIRPPKLKHDIRWGTGQIPSSLALLSELSDIPEAVFHEMDHPDIDRVMHAFINCVSEIIRTSMQKGEKPMATPMTPEQEREAELMADVPDPVDPRFPLVPGTVKRFRGDNKPAEDAGIDLAMPRIA